MEYKNNYDWKNVTERIEEELNLLMAKEGEFMDCRFEMATMKRYLNDVDQDDEGEAVVESKVLGLSSEPSDSILGM